MPPTAPEELYEGGTPATPAAPAALMGGGSPATATAATELLAGGSPASPAAPAALMGGGSPATATAATELLAGGSPASPAAPGALMGGGSPATPAAPGLLYPAGSDVGPAAMRVTPLLSPNVTGRLIRVPGVTLGAQPVWTNTGTLTKIAGENFQPPFIGRLVVLWWVAGAGWHLGEYIDNVLTAYWNAPDGLGSVPLNDPWEATDWAPMYDTGAADGVPGFTPAGVDVLVTASLSDPRLIGDFRKVAATVDGQPVWTKDGVPYVDGVAAMVFGAGVDEFDDGSYNLSVWTGGISSTFGFFSTSNGSPPPSGTWNFFGDEMGRITVSAIAASGPTAPASIV